MVGTRLSERIKTLSVRDQAYFLLRDLILDGTYVPGTRINLNTLSGELGISKTPLNEAIQKLTAEGLITAKPRSGTYVSKLAIDDIEQAFGFREIIEVGAAEVILENISEKEVAQLRSYHEKMKELLASTNLRRHYKDFVRLDTRFHLDIISLSGNPLILKHYLQVNTLLAVARLRDRYDHVHFEQTVAEHNAIVEAIEARDQRALVSAFREHARESLNKLRKIRSPLTVGTNVL